MQSSKEDIKSLGHTEWTKWRNLCYALTNKIEFEVNNFRAGRYIEIRTLFPTAMITNSGRTYSRERLNEVIEKETVWANEANARRARAENAKKAGTVIFVIIVAIIVLAF